MIDKELKKQQKMELKQRKREDKEKRKAEKFNRRMMRKAEKIDKKLEKIGEEPVAQNMLYSYFENNKIIDEGMKVIDQHPNISAANKLREMLKADKARRESLVQTEMEQIQSITESEEKLDDALKELGLL